MKQKKIGLYLATEPFHGGTYQYTLSIIKALTSFNPAEFSITVFYHESEWEKIFPDNFIKVKVERSFIRKLLSNLYKKIDRSINGYRRFSEFFNPAVELINNSDSDLIIFPNQDAQSYQVRKKSLVSIHDLMHRYEPYFEEYGNGVYKIRERHYKNICKYSAGVLVDSEIGKQQVIESYNKNPDEVFVLKFVPPYYLLEAKEVDVCTKFDLPDDFVFYPAQFWQHKNHENLVKAIKILKDRGKIINLVLVGSRKNYYKKIIDLIKNYELQTQILVLGYVTNDEIYSLYKKAKALVFVSLIGPTNIPPVEAMLVGCPVICSNKYAMPEQVADAALLVDPMNPEDIAEKIETLIYNESLQKELKEKGIQKSNSYTQNDFNNCFLKIINSLIE